MHAAPLALAVLLLFPDVGRPEPGAPGGPTVPEAPAPDRNWGEPPAGSTPEDVALWRRLHEATNDAVLAMSRVGQCSYRLKYGGYVEGLDAIAQASKDDRAAKATALRGRIAAAAKEADDAIPKEGLRVRLCKITLLHLEQRMDALDDPKLAVEMPQVRREAEQCADEVGAFARKVEPRADALEKALAEADAFLGRAAPASTAGSASAEAEGKPP